MNTKNLKNIVDNHFRLLRKPRIEILGYILFTEGRAIFTDLETWIEQPTDIVGTYCYHREDIKSLCIDYPNTDVEFTERGIILPNGNIFRAIVIDPQDFPNIPDVPFGGLLLTPYAQAKLRELAPMVNTDKRPVLHLQHIYIDKGTAVATNSHLMGWRDELGLAELTGFIPPHFFSYMDKKAEYSLLFDSYKEADEYHVSGWVHVWNRDISLKWQYTGRKFPDWKSVIPDYTNATNIYLPTETLVDFLKKVQDMAKLIKQVFTYIKIDPTKLTWEDNNYDKQLIQEVELGEFEPFHLDVKYLLLLIDKSKYSTHLEYLEKRQAVRINNNHIIMPVIPKL